MKLPRLDRATSAAVELVPQLAKTGAQVVVVIVKQRFEVRPGRPPVRVDGAEVKRVDELWDPKAPDRSSIKVPSDVCVRKPGTDVLISGEAVAPGRARVRQLDLSVKVGRIEKRLRVFGPRVWFKGLVGLTLTPPEPFEALPLRWEYAYGGRDESDPDHPLEEARNPVGRGVARDVSKLVHQLGPAIEDPAAPIGGLLGHPAPVGVGALGRHWMPRRKYVGTYDERWKRERMPLPPHDVIERYDQLAPLDQIVPSYLRGREPVVLEGMSEQGKLIFELPSLHFFVGGRIDGKLVEHRPALDTVLLFPTQRRVELVWRSAIPIPNPFDRLDRIQVHEKKEIG